MSTLIAEIRAYSREFVREWDLLREKKNRLGYSNSQCHAMVEIGRQGVMTVAGLSEVLQLDKSTTSRIVQQLQKQGLIASAMQTADKRQKPLQLTQQGRDTLVRLNFQADNRVSRVLDLLDETEVESLRHGMELYAWALRRSRLQRGFSIRPIEPGDNEAMAAIIFQVMTEFGAVGPGYSIEDAEVRTMYEAYSSPDASFFVLEKDGTVVGGGGIASLPEADPGVCELRKMYVLPIGRGIGMGKRLLRTCLDKARDLGYHTCYLETIGSMAQARKLYEEFGFRARNKPLGNTGHSSCEMWMEKHL